MVSVDAKIEFQELPLVPYQDATGLSWDKGTSRMEGAVGALTMMVDKLPEGLEIPYFINPENQALAVVEKKETDNIVLASGWRLKYHDAGPLGDEGFMLASILERKRNVGGVAVSCTYTIDAAGRGLRFMYSSATDKQEMEIVISTGMGTERDTTRALKSTIFFTDKKKGDRVAFSFNENNELVSSDIRRTSVAPVAADGSIDLAWVAENMQSLASAVEHDPIEDTQIHLSSQRLQRIYLGVVEQEGAALRINTYQTLRTLLANINAPQTESVEPNPVGLIAYDPQSLKTDIRGFSGYL